MSLQSIFGLEGRTAFVTGSSRGIGAAIATWSQRSRCQGCSPRTERTIDSGSGRADIPNWWSGPIAGRRSVRAGDGSPFDHAGRADLRRDRHFGHQRLRTDQCIIGRTAGRRSRATDQCESAGRQSKCCRPVFRQWPLVAGAGSSISDQSTRRDRKAL